MGTLRLLVDPQYWSSLFNSPWTVVVSLIDIIIVTILIYNFIRAIAGTKIMTLVRGVLLFVAAQVLAQLIGLQTISWLLNQVLSFGVIAIVVLFAPELRNILEKLGRSTQIFTTQTVTQEEQLVKAFVRAVEYMSPRKIGALVSVEGSQTLQEYISTGIRLDADISAELLINIFIPNTPLHDGAVIIQDNKIAVSCAYLPLSESTQISKQFGTRHRAAIGLSEATDAFTFIVSEETGDVSIARKGNFRHGLSITEFENELRTLFLKDEAMSRPKIWQKWLRNRGGRRL